MTEEEYKSEWLAGLHHTEYNNCRFAEDKVQYTKDWLLRNRLVDENYKPCTNFIANVVCAEKLYIATVEAYRDLCARWTDKIQARQELKNLGMSELVYDENAYCEYSLLTNQKVSNLKSRTMFKCNHGSNWNVKYLDSRDVDIVLKKINTWQTLNYAYVCGYEAQYENIKPGYIIQTLLPKTPIDYNFWCIDSEVVAVGLTKKLDNDITEHLAFTDKFGKRLDWCVGAKPEMDNLQSVFKKSIDKMMSYVKEISKLFKFVRIDMFTVDGAVKFGEATLTPCGGKIIVQKV